MHTYMHTHIIINSYKHTHIHAGVCTFGFEPNPGHAPWLHRLQTFLRAHDFPVMFFTTTAVTGKDQQNVTFFFDSKEQESNEVGASLVKGATSGEDETVTTAVSLHSVMAEIKAYGNVDTLLIKVDMEGSEYEALPGTLC